MRPCLSRDGGGEEKSVLFSLQVVVCLVSLISLHSNSFVLMKTGFTTKMCSVLEEIPMSVEGVWFLPLLDVIFCKCLSGPLD